MMHSQPTDAGAFTHRLAFTASARTAWRLILENVLTAEGTSILIPAYIGITDREGSGVFDPVQQTATPHTFYPLDNRLRPDLDTIETMLATKLHSLLLVIHYFGLVQADLERLKMVCQRHDVLLIEDCAHVPVHWIDPHGLGGIGDASFYSLHKSLPISSGGALRINSHLMPDIPIPPVDRCDATGLDLLLRADFAAIARRRRSNYAWLAERLADIDGLTVLYPDIGQAVPLNLAVFIHDGHREKLYFSLKKTGFQTTALYYRLIDAISPQRFPLSHVLSQGILNLPVHQEVDPSDLGLLLRHLEEKLREVRLSSGLSEPDSIRGRDAPWGP